MTALADRTNWQALRTTAERLAADRLRTDPDSVAAGSLTPAAADARNRVARALVAIWTAVEHGQDIPDLPAYDIEITADLTDVAANAAKVAAARPADAQLALYAARLATLAHHHRPYREGTSTAAIVFFHGCNQQARAERGALPPKGNTGGDHVDRSAARAPLMQQAAAHPPRAAATQPGLL